jgi:hypothetical protein
MLREHLSQEHDAASAQAYTDDDYRALLAQCGFVGVTLYPSLTGQVNESQSGLLAITARRP